MKNARWKDEITRNDSLGTWVSERRIYFLCHFPCIRPVSKKKFPWPCYVLCEHYLTKLVIFWCPEQELWLFKQSYCNSLGNNAPSSPNDVFIFYVISLVYVLSQKKIFLGLATSFASITWPSSLFSDAQNMSYGCLNKDTAIRCVITDPVNDFNYCEIPASKQRTDVCTLLNAVIDL